MNTTRLHKLRAEWLWDIGVKVKDYNQHFTNMPSAKNWAAMHKRWNEMNSQALFGL